jgi:cell division protein FtsB
VLKAQYEEDKRKLKSLDEYESVERLAREKYLMKRAGEDIFVIKYKKPAE